MYTEFSTVVSNHSTKFGYHRASHCNHSDAEHGIFQSSIHVVRAAVCVQLYTNRVLTNLKYGNNFFIKT